MARLILNPGGWRERRGSEGEDCGFLSNGRVETILHEEARRVRTKATGCALFSADEPTLT